ncbi:unnamed protein product, partial [Polarella glacialis]
QLVQTTSDAQNNQTSSRTTRKLISTESNSTSNNRNNNNSKNNNNMHKSSHGEPSLPACSALLLQRIERLEVQVQTLQGGLESRLQSVGAALRAAAEGVAEGLCRELDARLRVLEASGGAARASSEGDIEALWGSLQQLDGQMQRSVREAEAELQRLEQRLEAVQEPPASNPDIIGALAPVHEQLRVQREAWTVTQRRLTACEATVACWGPLEPRFKSMEEHLNRQSQ